MISGRLSDFHRSRYTKNNKDCPPDPEHRLHLQFPGILLSLSGIVMYGWFVRYRIHVASVIVASSLSKLLPHMPRALPLHPLPTKLTAIAPPSCLWHDLGFHNHDIIPNGKLQENPRNVSGAGKSVSQPSGCRRSSSCGPADGEDGHRLVFHGAGACRARLYC
jgi:hypothetical protein